jgi:hypothetical protein
MYVLQEAKPGEETTVVVERADGRIRLDITFGESSGAR